MTAQKSKECSLVPLSVEPLQELVVEVTDDDVRATLEAMTQSLAAAARAREIRFGSAATDTAIPGVRIDIVPEEKKSA